jgi:hypothetical protein
VDLSLPMIRYTGSRGRQSVLIVFDACARGSNDIDFSEENKKAAFADVFRDLVNIRCFHGR